MFLCRLQLLRISIAASAIVGTIYAQSPSIAPNGIVNSADYSRDFAPGALITIFGSGLASASQEPSGLPLPNLLAGTSVQLVGNGELLPLWYVSPTQINAQLPYDVAIGRVQVRVITSSASSNIDTITVGDSAPKLFTVDLSGHGQGIVTAANYNLLSASHPAGPGQTVILWMNSLGITSGGPVAGEAAAGASPGSVPSVMTKPLTVTVGGAPAAVVYAGLSPGSTGLYQVNVQLPLAAITGPLEVRVVVAGATSQTNVTLPYRQLGLYYALLGGKPVPGETLNGVSGPTSALAYQQADPTAWGLTGLNAWTNSTGLGSQYAAASGLAMTFLNGIAIVYDNNGIETGTYGKFYDNSNGPPNSQKPGLTDLYSMSNYFSLVFAGHFRLLQPASITTMIGYFDAAGVQALPFDPSNPYVQYRMNLWSNAAGPLPKSTGTFTGDVFSSDKTAGTFSFSNTGVNMISSTAGDAPKPIFRLVYELAAPITLPAGEYWFCHDASVRTSDTPVPASELITADEFARWVPSLRPLAEQPRRVSLFGVEFGLHDLWSLPRVVTVRPGAPLEQH